MSRYRIGMESVATDADGWSTALHVHPGSTVQVGLQPSPAAVLPSSHSSVSSTIPSPQTAVQVPPRQWGSIVQVCEQPSYGMRLPSSHSSVPSTIPSPHTGGGVLVAVGVFGGVCVGVAVGGSVAVGVGTHIPVSPAAAMMRSLLVSAASRHCV